MRGFQIAKAGGLVVPVAALLLLGASGCAGGKNPFTGKPGSVFEALIPRKPGEIAKDAVNPSVDVDKRRRALEQLSSAKWGGEKPYLRLYRVYVDNPGDDDTIISVCVRALGRHGGPQDVPRLTKMLSKSSYDPPVYVRWEAAKALQRIHDRKAISPLISAAVNDQEPDVRMAAVQALGQYDEPAVFDALVGALNDSHFAVRHGALESLKLLTGQDYGDDIRPWITWGKVNRRDLFAGKQPYTWQPYDKPRGLWDKVRFWRKKEPVLPRAPTGLQQATVDSDEQAAKLTEQ